MIITLKNKTDSQSPLTAKGADWSICIKSDSIRHKAIFVVKIINLLMSTNRWIIITIILNLLQK